MSNGNQKTLKEPIELHGVGLHNGVKVNVCLKPAEVNSGIKFKRIEGCHRQKLFDSKQK